MTLPTSAARRHRDGQWLGLLRAQPAECLDQLILGHRGATLDAELPGSLPQLLDGSLLVGTGPRGPAGLHLCLGRLDLGRLELDVALPGGLGLGGHDGGGALGRLHGALGRLADAGAGRLHAAPRGAAAVERLAGGWAGTDRADQLATPPGEVVELAGSLAGEAQGARDALLHEVAQPLR